MKKLLEAGAVVEKKDKVSEDLFPGANKLQNK